MKWLSIRITLAIVTLIAWFPLLVLILSLVIGSAARCSVKDGFLQRCMISSIDLSDILYTVMTLSWLVVAAAPLMLLTLLAWIFIGVRAVLRRRKAVDNLSR